MEGLNIKDWNKPDTHLRLFLCAVFFLLLLLVFVFVSHAHTAHTLLLSPGWLAGSGTLPPRSLCLSL